MFDNVELVTSSNSLLVLAGIFRFASLVGSTWRFTRGMFRSFYVVGIMCKPSGFFNVDEIL